MRTGCLFPSCHDAWCLMPSVRIPSVCMESQPQRSQRPETPDLLPPAGPDRKRSRPPQTGQHFTLPQTVTGFPAGYELSLHFDDRRTESPPPPARTHVHHLVFRDRGWYRRFLRFERGRAPNSLNSNSFPPLRKPDSFLNPCNSRALSACETTSPKTNRDHLRYSSPAAEQTGIDYSDSAHHVHLTQQTRPEANAPENSSRRSADRDLRCRRKLP